MVAAFSQRLTDTIQIHEVVINENKLSGQDFLQITRLDSTELENNHTENLSDLLTKHSDIFIKSYGHGQLATASFRGSAPSHTKVQWNGIGLNSPMLGQVDFSLVPVFFVDEINIFYSGSSVSKTSGALGGSISLNNTPQWNKRLFAEILAGYGSFDTYHSYTSFGGGNKKIQYKSSLFYDYSKNNFRYFNNAVLPNTYQRLQNAELQGKGFLQDIYLRINDKNILSVKYWRQKSDRNIPQIMSHEGNNRKENQKDDINRGVITWEYYGPHDKLLVLSGFNTKQLDYRIFHETYGGTLTQIESGSHAASYYNQIDYQRKINNYISARLALDANFHRVNIAEATTETGYTKNRYEGSLLSGITVQINQSFRSYFFARQNITDGAALPVIPSAGFTFIPFSDTGFQIKSNISRNYRIPSLNDLYWEPGGNPELEPERGISSDITLQYDKTFQDVRLKGKMTGFYADITNWILWEPGEFHYWSPKNIQKVRSRGIETGLELDGTISSFHYKIKGNFTMTHTTNLTKREKTDNSYGKQLILIPKKRFYSFINIRKDKYFFHYDVQYTGKRYTSTDNSSHYSRPLPSYSLHNMSIGSEFCLWNMTLLLKLNLKNVIDVNYQVLPWRPMPGRHFSVSLKLKYNKPM